MTNPPEAFEPDWESIQGAWLESGCLRGLQAYHEQLARHLERQRPTPPGTPAAGTYTQEEVQQILRNMGHDVECGACMAIAYTSVGLPGDEHTCKPPEPATAVGETCARCGKPETQHWAGGRCFNFESFSHFKPDDRPALRARVAELEKKLRGARNAFFAAADERDAARRELATVKTHAANVWLWQGDGDKPDSLVCPVVMSAETCRQMTERITDLEQQLAAAQKQADANLLGYNTARAELSETREQLRVTLLQDAESCRRVGELRRELNGARAEIRRITPVYNAAVAWRVHHSVPVRAISEAVDAALGRTAAEKQEKSE